ncbi:hypothetical protein BEWA_004110 [Theileria equi strain WA]|uniref:Uncharacterized protein n=1 Tax=Theileria equi strain WA TaxID=1537102 RepID=L0B0I4_THEEQ|nr:hypothetical protein BEWA_004110 [Theileria equi strain WA]AFZ81003.1 hypothetical protein BEWA_004110 [Theileria equi strain WA]|eukprot:XP_004830669.1 hypothetical protein BEWA_004110 [Theileria equi strain WA]
MAPPSDGVTIDISHKPDGNGGTHTTTYDYKDTGSRKEIKVTLTIEPPNSDFLKYTHQDKHNTDGTIPFKLEKVRDDDQRDIIPDLPRDNVEKVHVYYWKHENSNPPKKVLLVGVTTDRRTKYYAKSSDGNKWVEQQLDGNNLEKVLDEQNCKHNDAVTINLSHSASTENDCCDEHKGENKISVEKVEIEVDGKKKTEYTKYSITGGQLAGIKFYKDGASNDEKNRKTITAKAGLNFPIKGPVDIYTFYSNKEPELIYIEQTGTNNPVSGWFKKGGENKPWTEVSNKLQGINKDKIDNKQITCQQRAALAKELKLGSNNLQECTPAGAGRPRDAEAPGLKGPAGEDDQSGGPDSTKSGASGSPVLSPTVASDAHTPDGRADGDSHASEFSPKAQAKSAQQASASALSPGPDSPGGDLQPGAEAGTALAHGGDSSAGPPTPKPAPFTGPGLATLGYALSGTLAGSGAVGLAGYHLYKNSRDPWVRQI